MGAHRRVADEAGDVGPEREGLEHVRDQLPYASPYHAWSNFEFVALDGSPYEVDLDWSAVNEPSQMKQIVGQLGRASAKIHCASDEDSDQDLVRIQVEEAIVRSLAGRRRDFVDWLCQWGIDYAERVREDHVLFVDAFREGRIGIRST